MKLIQKICSSVLIRVYILLKKTKIFNKLNVPITTGFLKNYKWALTTSDETYLSGLFDTFTIKEFEKHIKKGDIVFDLGSNEGYYSIVASKLVGDKGKVFSFEPMPENFALLENHIKINKIENVVAINKAVSDSVGVLNFTNTEDRAGNTYMNSSPKFTTFNNTIKIDSISLDSFMNDVDFIPPNFIKIDVEGAEHDVLIGASNLIQRYKPVILLATHDFHKANVKEDCLNFIKQFEYKFIKLDNHQSQDFSDFIMIP